MRKIATTLLLALALTATGCHTSTEFGECKGFATADEENPNLQYEVSVNNVFWAFVFSETLFWPGLTAAFWYKCPVARKAAPAK